MSEEIIKIPRKKEFMTLMIGFSFLTIFLLVMFDILELGGAQQINFSDMAYLGLLHVFLIGLMGVCIFLTLPNFLLTYSKEGIRWLSLRGYELVRWSEINEAMLNVTFWRGIRIILVSPGKTIIINSQLFANADEAITEIRKHIPEDRWNN